MKYSFRYYNDNAAMEIADEIIIKYTEKDPELINFVKKYSNKRIVVDTSHKNEELEEDIDIFKAAEVTVMATLENYIPLKNNNIPFFFCEEALSLRDFSLYLNKGVTDIRIDGELGFFLPSLKEHTEINIRVSPNFALDSNNLTSFFIRPEDLELYENYIDIIEFRGHVAKQSILYENYTKDKKWGGDLNILIHNAPSIDNTQILPNFGKNRLNCKMRCTYGACEICKHIQDVSEILKEKNLNIVKKREKNESKIVKTDMSNDTRAANGSDDSISTE